MTGQEAELLPIITTNDDGETVHLCGVCKAPYTVASLARFCALSDAATLAQGPGVAA